MTLLGEDLFIPKIRDGCVVWVVDSFPPDVAAIERALSNIPGSEGYYLMVSEESNRLSHIGEFEGFGPYKEFCMIPTKYFKVGGFRLPLKQFFLEVLYLLGVASGQLSINAWRIMTAYYINCFENNAE